ncbi:uncharacterized protein YALI1_D30850g [Yarrowia lipolytica]|uniref:Uncharacterized protein n=1 Tax=Yarrowia lipolytica TaxID=4952 RepID=A0A1D8NFX3_YARLL|nr:hypothetical protein YALI1_D30850g [Yarrowia lipolytica]
MEILSHHLVTNFLSSLEYWIICPVHSQFSTARNYQVRMSMSSSSAPSFTPWEKVSRKNSLPADSSKSLRSKYSSRVRGIFRDRSSFLLAKELTSRSGPQAGSQLVLVDSLHSSQYKDEVR